MATLVLTAQDVNGDPFVSGSNINIINNSTSTLTFTETDFQLFDPQPGETVSLDGGLTQLNYTFLGYGDVRGDPLQHAGFIRVDMGDGTFQTFAIDMNVDGDQAPTLATGNTKLAVTNLTATESERFPGPACFTPGTLIDTPDGPRPCETLKAGDLVDTLDDGPQPLRIVICDSFRATGEYAPIRFAPGTIGNDAALIVSQQHRMLITGWRAELYCGQREVLVAAKHLVNGDSIRVVPGGTVDYIHLLFDRHQIVFANGAPTESFYPAALETAGDAATRAEFLRFFPGCDSISAVPSDLARPEMRGIEARLMAA